MPHDVPTCWNSTFNMLDFALEYKAAINTITGNRDMKMQTLELDAPKWTIASQLQETLRVSQVVHAQQAYTDFLFQIFKHATLFFSRDMPNVSTVIPAMDLVNEYLATSTDSPSFMPSVHSALAIRKQTLNRYYNKTDYLEIYQIAMGESQPCALPFS